EAAEAKLLTAVAAARENDRSWTEIANVLGVSRQAARQRFADAVVGAPPTHRSPAAAGPCRRRRCRTAHG
ncbi:MAG TPA: hypothetical protein VFU35_08815, partial [Jatrophihabitans sp.]|nr:hypothetical protein [Jatrophihabitans sp.]